MVEEQELHAASHTGRDEIETPEKLSLSGSHETSPAYWRRKLLDVQAVFERPGKVTVFMTIIMNVWREDIKRFGLDNENSWTVSPQDD